MADDTLMRSQEFVQREQMQGNAIRANASARAGQAVMQAGQDVQNNMRFSQQMERQREMDAFSMQLQQSQEMRSKMEAESRSAYAEAQFQALQQKILINREVIESGSLAKQREHEDYMRGIEKQSAEFQLEQMRRQSKYEEEDRAANSYIEPARILAAVGWEATPAREGEEGIPIPGASNRIMFRPAQARAAPRDDLGDASSFLRALTEAGVDTGSLQGPMIERLRDAVTGGGGNLELRGEIRNIEMEEEKLVESLNSKIEGMSLNPRTMAQAMLAAERLVPESLVREYQQNFPELTPDEAFALVAYISYVKSSEGTKE